LVEAYLSAFAEEDSRGTLVLAVEAVMQAPLVDPFTGNELGIPLLGITDLLLETEEGPLIVDFKTASRASCFPAIVHEIQLTSYAYLFRKFFEREEAGLEIRSLIKTKTPQVRVRRFPPRGREHFRRLFDVVRAYLDDLTSGRFVFRPGLACTICDYRESHCVGEL
jgi:hypothetical protein